MDEKNEKAQNSKKSNRKSLYEAVESSLTADWQPYNTFAHKVRTTLRKDVEWLEISNMLQRYIEKNTTKVKNGKKYEYTLPVEWQNEHTDNCMIRLRSGK